MLHIFLSTLIAQNEIFTQFSHPCAKFPPLLSFMFVIFRTFFAQSPSRTASFFPAGSIKSLFFATFRQVIPTKYKTNWIKIASEQFHSPSSYWVIAENWTIINLNNADGYDLQVGVQINSSHVGVVLLAFLNRSLYFPSNLMSQ